jgi:lipopolysaccharide transport system ATP-binding protein
MGDVAEEGRTVLFVSHNMAAITRLCRWGIWLDQGRLRDFGPAEDVVAQYFAAGTHALGELTFHEPSSRPTGSESIRLLALRIRSSAGEVSASIDARAAFDVEIEYEILRPSSSLRVGFSLTAHDGTVVFSSTDADTTGGEEGRAAGTYVSTCTVPGSLLNYGQYFVSVGADTPMIQRHFFVERALTFSIEQTGGTGAHISDGRQGVLRPALPWTIRRRP